MNTSRRRFLGGMLAGMGMSGSLQAAAPATNGTALLTPTARRAIDRGLAYLVGKQNPAGTFGTGGYSGNPAVGGLCGMALLANGSTPRSGPFAVIVQNVLEYLLANVADSGLIHAGPSSGREPMYGHGFATLFLAEVYGTTTNGSVRDKLARAVRLIVSSQNDEGGWRYEPRRHEADISVTACQLMALRAARNAGLLVPNETIDRAIDYVKRCQNTDGGFMYMPSQPGDSRFPRSAAAIVALMSAGIYDSDEVRRGLQFIEQNVPKVRTVHEQSYFLYGHYYAVQAFWQLGGERWSTWYAGIRDFLVASQRKDGAWDDAVSLEYGAAMACLVLQMPSNYLPIFQR